MSSEKIPREILDLGEFAGCPYLERYGLRV
jgi:hypothetical protein